MVANVAVIWKVRPDAEPPDRARLAAGGVLAAQMDPAAVGNDLAVEHVEAGALAGAVGADQRQDFTGLQREDDAAHRMDAAIGFGQAFDRQQRGRVAHSALSIPGASGFGSADRRRWRSVSRHADDALGKRDHDQDDDAAQHQLGPVGLAHQPDAERLVDDGADHRAGNRLDAAEQHHDQRIDRQRNAEAVGKHAALEVGEQRAGDARHGAGDHEGGPLHALAVDPDRLAAQRRIARRPQRIAERREHDDPQAKPRKARRCRATASRNAPATAAHGSGQTPEDAVVAAGHATHWNAIDQTICAKASVSIAK